MAYVYEKVASDQHSHQTPHYGFLDGDGDFVFDTTPLEKLDIEETKGKDLLVNVGTATPILSVFSDSISDSLKQLISDPREQIRLDDFVSSHLRRAIQLLDLQNFPASESITDETFKGVFAGRLKQYEEATADLRTIVILLARWATPNQIPLLTKIFARLAEVDKGGNGLITWLRLGWYPIQLLMYASGIAALSSRNFDALRVILTTQVKGDLHSSGMPNVPLIIPVTEATTEIYNSFKFLPGHERHFVPRSEYLFTLLQPPIEDILFLGQSYETHFDEFEVLWALVYADIKTESPPRGIWGPPGRFVWKQQRGVDRSPFEQFVKAAQEQGQNWAALEAGLFKKSPQRFGEIADAYRGIIPQFGYR
jgi:hypothetical protein